ncbi:MAG: acyltransferase [Actinomycetota bacterium]|nr:acyltransferase [Actinomycetota bacterium]
MRPGTTKPPPAVAGPLFVPTLHGIRGIALLLVIAFHVGGAARWTANDPIVRAFYEYAGPMALDLLFFTTGFVLFLPVVRNAGFGSVRAFAIRRFARVAPPYYVCMLLVLVLFPLLSNQAIENAADRGLDGILIHAAFLQRIVSPATQGFLVNSPVWSISVDLVFYLVLPLVASSYLRHPLAGLAIAVVASAAWRFAFLEPDAQGLYDGLDYMIQAPLFMADFASGMTGAWAFVRLSDSGWPRAHARTMVVVTLVAATALVGLAYVGGANIPYHLGIFQEPAAVRAALPLVLAVFVVAVSLAPRWLQWPLTNRGPLYWFSEISYSVYLYHFPVIFFGFYTIGIPQVESFLWKWAVYVFVVSIAIGAVSYYVIELPSRRIGRRLARRYARGRPRDPPGKAPAPGGLLGSGDAA